MMADLQAEKNDFDGKERLANIGEMLSGINTFCEQNAENEADDNSLTSIEAYLADVALLTDQDTNTDETTDRITLMTIHSSKGLEFDNVYIVGVEDELFPGGQSVANPQAIEEERRLFYVAITRAKQCCTISYTRQRFQYGKTNQSRPSRFIAELSEEYVVKPKDRFSQGNLFGASAELTRNRRPQWSRPQQFSPQPKPTFSKFSPSNASAQPASIESVEEFDYKGNNYRVGQKVEHETFGRGQIVLIDNQGDNTKLRIDFGPRGVKQLLIKFARLKALD